MAWRRWEDKERWTTERSIISSALCTISATKVSKRYACCMWDTTKLLKGERQFSWKQPSLIFQKTSKSKNRNLRTSRPDCQPEWCRFLRHWYQNYQWMPSQVWPPKHMTTCSQAFVAQGESTGNSSDSVKSKLYGATPNQVSKLPLELGLTRSLPYPLCHQSSQAHRKRSGVFVKWPW